jgi:hypothetical protein
MAVSKDNYKVEEVAAEVQNAYDFLEQGHGMLSYSILKNNFDLNDRFYEVMQDLANLREEVEKTVE